MHQQPPEVNVITINEKNKQPRKIKITKTVERLEPKEGLSKNIPFHRIIFDYEFLN